MTDPMVIMRGVIEAFEAKVATGTEDPAAVVLTVKRIIGAALAHGRRPRKKTEKKPPRGLGYTKDEALIIASLPWHKGNMSAAIRAHYPLADGEQIRVHAKRIRERTNEIEEVIGDDHPWENAGNWLGDLIAE